MIVLSICIPTYKHPKLILDCVKSIISYKNQDIEIIVFHDGLSDGSKEQVEKVNDSRIKYLHHQKRIGYASSILKLIEIARGEFIFLLSDEDYINPKNLPWLIKMIKKKEDLSQIIGVIEYENRAHNKVYSAPWVNQQILKAGHESLTNLLFKYNHMSGIILKKKAINLYKLKKYLKGYYSPYLPVICQCQAMIVGNTLLTSKVLCYFGANQGKSHHITIDGHQYWHPISRIYHVAEKINIIFDIIKEKHTQRFLINRQRIYTALLLVRNIFSNSRIFFKLFIILLKIEKCRNSLFFWKSLFIQLFYKIKNG